MRTEVRITEESQGHLALRPGKNTKKVKEERDPSKDPAEERVRS